jgi:hypothetical protein
MTRLGLCNHPIPITYLPRKQLNLPPEEVTPQSITLKCEALEGHGGGGHMIYLGGDRHFVAVPE